MLIKNKFIGAVINVILLVSILNFFILMLSIPVAEFATGDNLLKESIGPSNDIEDRIMLTENEKVIISFRTKEQGVTELLNIEIVDPENEIYSWEKSFTAPDEPGKSKTFTEFIPGSSGMHNIKISNAEFDTDVSLVSGKFEIYNQPLFLEVWFFSTIFLLIGSFFFRVRKTEVFRSSGRSIKKTSDKIQARPYSFKQKLISLSISLFIFYRILSQ